MLGVPLPQRYVLREAGIGFAVTALLLAGLMVLGGGAGLARQAEGVGASLLVRLLPELMVTVSGLVLPVALLLATTFTFSRLAAEGELDAFRAAGIPARRLLPPVLLLALLTTAVLTVLIGNVAPRAQHRLRTAVKEALRDALLKLGPGPRVLKIGATTVAWSDYRAGVVHDLRVMVAPDGHLRGTLVAERAILRFDAVHDELVFDVEHAYAVWLDPEHGRRAGTRPPKEIKGTSSGARGEKYGDERVVVTEHYQRLVIPIGEKFSRRRRLDNLDLNELHGLRHTWCDNPKHGLPKRQQNGRIRSWSLAAHDTELVKRALLPWAPLFLVLVGAAMGCAARRSSRLAAFAYGLGPVLLVYYLPLQIGESLGRQGRWPPELAIGLPHALLLLLGALCCWRWCWR